jgi:glycerate kinase
MRLLVAPDKFRGTLTAAQASDAIAAGWRRDRPGDEVIELPLADGGEGTLEALVGAGRGSVRTVRVTGPLGDPVEAGFGLVEGPSGPVGIVEMARASGSACSTRPPPLPGTGELIARPAGPALGRSSSVSGERDQDGAPGC